MIFFLKSQWYAAYQRLTLDARTHRLKGKGGRVHANGDPKSSAGQACVAHNRLKSESVAKKDTVC